MNQPAYLENVREQYENYPYPLRKPEEEKTRLRAPILESLDRLNHYGFEGRRNFHKNFRALVAGGGTGDAAIFLAEQLRDTEAEIVYLDISTASMNIAKERAKVRGLNNIAWHHASILDAPNLNLGKFDYINCSGVLHHLKDPDAGLAALNAVLSDDGVMGLLLYGQYGRAGVYQMQEMMRLIGADDPIEQRIHDCRTILKRLPQTNWFQHNYQRFGDLTFGDIGIYDLFLHSQDRAYTIPQLYEYIERQGLVIVSFLEPHLYDLSCYIEDQSLLSKLMGKDEKTRNAIGELLSGMAAKHTFYASRTRRTPPSVDDVNMVPCLPAEKDPVTYKKLYEAASQAQGHLVFTLTNKKVIIPKSEELVACFKYMDGRLSLKEIYQKAATLGNFKHQALKDAFTACYNMLEGTDFMFLRHKDVPRYHTLKDLEDRLKG